MIKGRFKKEMGMERRNEREKTHGEPEGRALDLQIIVVKYLNPILEKRRLVLLFFCIGLIVSLPLSLFVNPEYVSEATVQLEEPRTTIWEIKQAKGSLATKPASEAFVLAEAERIKSGPFLSEVMKILPSEVEEELQFSLDLYPQLIGGIKGAIKDLIGEKWVDRIKALGGKKTESAKRTSKREGLLMDLKSRITVRTQSRRAMIWLSARTLDKYLAPMLVQSCIDVLVATNLEKNKKAVALEKKFAKDQKDGAYRVFREAEKELRVFKKSLDIPSDTTDLVLDPETEAKLDKLQTKLKMARDSLDFMEKAHISTQIREAGIATNIKVIDAPAMPVSAVRNWGKPIILIGTLVGLIIGISIALLLEFLKGTVRHEIDIIDSVQLPILGHIPAL